MVTGSRNTAVGYGALYENISSNNTAIGTNSGVLDTIGSFNTYIGFATSNSRNYSYSTAVGQYASISGNNQIVLGTTSDYVYIPSTTVSTTTTTGALVVKGGVGISGNVYVGGNLYTTGSINVNYTSLPTFGNSSIGTKLTYTSTSSTSLDPNWSEIIRVETLPAGVWNVSISYKMALTTDGTGNLNYFAFTSSVTAYYLNGSYIVGSYNPSSTERYDMPTFFNQITSANTDINTTANSFYKTITTVITQTTSGTDWYFVAACSETSKTTISEITAIFYRIA
jgi:hypothetical protein